MAIFAHTGPCRASEVVSTLGIATALGMLLFRPWRRAVWRERLMAMFVPVLLAAVVTGGACASKSSPSKSRPTTSARIVIEAPTPNAIVPPDTTLRVRIIGGQVVARTTGKLTATDGHVHVMLDGKLIVMSYQTTQDLRGLSPGPHNLQAEFVAVDHAPFKNRQVAAVLFTVKSP